MSRRCRITRIVTVMAMIWAGLATGAAAQQADDDVYPMVFPVPDATSYTDTYGAPRSGGRTHQGTDIFAPKGAPVVAVSPGTVVRITTGERAGRYIVIEHVDGWRSYYLHLDNDTEGTDDGLGGAPAEGIVVGATVEAGQVIDYVGDSGNAEETPPHLHFELHDSNGNIVNPYPHLRAAQTGNAVFTGSPRPPRPRQPDTLNTALVGSLNPGGGFAAGITVHEHTAYLGTWGRPEVCPSSGVRVIDVADPTKPVELTAIATGEEYPGTSTDSVWVGAVETDAFTGDLAVVAVRRCENNEPGRFKSGFRGLALYDVTDTAAPALLGLFDVGDATQGVHELDVAVRDDGSVIVAATVMQSLIHTDGAGGDVRIVDATDPTAPIEIADWDVRRDGGLGATADPSAARDEEELHAHGVTFSHDGSRLWVASWDAGLAVLEMSDPAFPQLVGRVPIDPDAEGNVHAVTIDEERSVVLRSDEDLFPSDTQKHREGWGTQRVYDLGERGRLSEIAEITTRAATDVDGSGTIRRDGYFSAHEAVVVDGVAYSAWYSAGVRIVDLADPAAPVEIGHFVPPASVDPTGHWKAPDESQSFPMVWGVAAADGLIYASDMHTGLWIFRFDDGLSEEMAAPGPADWSPVR